MRNLALFWTLTIIILIVCPHLSGLMFFKINGFALSTIYISIGAGIGMILDNEKHCLACLTSIISGFLATVFFLSGMFLYTISSVLLLSFWLVIASKTSESDKNDSVPH